MDVQLDLSMRTAGILENRSLTDYESEYKEILQTLSTGLERRVIDGHQCSSRRTVQSCLRHDLMGAYSGPISAQVTLALIAQWTSSASVFTLVQP